MGKMTNEQLNELLARALGELHDEGLTIITADVWAKPWLPESYWRQQAADWQQQARQAVATKAVRRAEDEYLASTVSVADVLEEGVPKLWKPEHPTHWGTQPMARSHGETKPPTQGPQQPSFDFECYQCGRPITDDGGGYWKDHAGRNRCDLALLDQETIDREDYWTDHQPKPIRGEEEDEGDR